MQALALMERIAMRFLKWPFGETATDVETLERLRQLPQVPAAAPALEPLSLFDETIHQTPKRSALWTPEQAYRRGQRAKHWRYVRRVLYSLPAAERADWLTVWRAPAAKRLYPGTPQGAAQFLACILEDESIEKNTKKIY